MKLFYFVGGPKPGRAEEFLQRLGQIRTPPGWIIYPHIGNDAKALHIAPAESRQDVLDHLDVFGDMYEHGNIIEIREPNSGTGS